MMIIKMSQAEAISTCFKRLQAEPTQDVYIRIFASKCGMSYASFASALAVATEPFRAEQVRNRA